MLVSLWKKLIEVFRPKKERRYDNVKVHNAFTGEVIEGHDAVKAHFEKEQKLYEEFGSNLFFQIYRANLSGRSWAELQGPKIGEYIAGGDFVPGNLLVREVHSKLARVLSEKSKTQPEFKLGEEDRLSFFFSNRYMWEDRRFYSDHFMLLPAWIQVVIHPCDSSEFISLLKRALAVPEQDQND